MCDAITCSTGGSMIDLYYAPTPNGHKITLFLEEAGLPYNLHRIDIGAGDQFKPEFLAISPNNKIPAIVDQQPIDGGKPIAIFESGAILTYLAEKTSKFLSTDMRERIQSLQWLFWQVGGFGPMLGQNHHFNHFAPEKVPYAINRYQAETKRLYQVLNTQLEKTTYLGGQEYSIADISTYPWVRAYERQNIDLNDYPAVKKWFDTISQRPATQIAYSKA